MIWMRDRKMGRWWWLGLGLGCFASVVLAGHMHHPFPDHGSPHTPIICLTSEKLSSPSLQWHSPCSSPSPVALPDSVSCPHPAESRSLGLLRGLLHGVSGSIQPFSHLLPGRGKTAKRKASKCQALDVCSWAQLSVLDGPDLGFQLEFIGGLESGVKE